MRSLPNFVLIHGAWVNGSCWSGVIQRLQKAGYHVTAPQLPLTSLAEDVARVRQVLVAQSGATILVGHSFGGAVISQLGTDAPNVVGLVYLSALAPAMGETMKDLFSGGPQPASVAALRPDKQGFFWLDQEGFVQYLAPDVDAVQARVLAAVQQPIAASEFWGEEPFGEPAWQSLPSWYLVSEDDQMLPAPVQHFFAERMGATTSSIAASHVAMISHPDVVADLFKKVAQQLGDSGE